MELFFLTKSVSYVKNTLYGSRNMIIESAKEEEIEKNQINSDRIYIGTPFGTMMIQKALNDLKLDSQVKLVNEPDKSNILKIGPYNLTCKDDMKPSLQPLIDKKKDTIKILFINGFGAGIGDNLIALSALRIYKRYLKQFFRNVEFHIFNEDLELMELYYRQENLIKSILPQPTNVTTFFTFDAYVDLGGMIQWKEFNDRPMIDSYLNTFGVDAQLIPDFEKRITLVDNCYSDIYNILKGFKIGKKILLFQYKSSSLSRSIPEDIALQMLDTLCNNTDYTVISVTKTPFVHKNFFDLSEYSKNIFDYITIVSFADKIITVDTGTYHIADYFNIPTAVLFTTINPEYRVKYYPFTKGYAVSQKLLNMDFKDVADKHRTDSQDILDIVKDAFSSVNIHEILEDLGW
ncbi:MAG: hypothetical protein QXP36_10485 [Conexivisphaerales archaeon]